jgi:hypothetical protein
LTGPQGPIGLTGPQGPAGSASADDIISGTLSEARLPANIAFLDRENMFGLLNHFAAGVAVDADSSFAAGLNVGGTLALKASSGRILSGGNNLLAWSGTVVSPFQNGGGIHAQSLNAVQNTFLGIDSGQQINDGANNTGVGFSALSSNTDGSGNVALGSQALQSNTTGGYNIAIGAGALQFSSTENYNVAVGAQTLFVNKGSENTALGAFALQANEPGNFNTAVGANALRSNSNGSLNTAAGYRALEANSSGEGNAAFGERSLLANSTGNYNTAIGSEALFANTTGSGNSVVGAVALAENVTGSQNTVQGSQSMNKNSSGSANTALGSATLQYNTTGNFNIALGYRAGDNLTTGDNNIMIGNRGVADEANAIRIGTENTQTSAYVAGINNATVSGGVPVYVDGDGRLGTITSSRRFKREIAPMDDASESILKLAPVTFRYNPELDSAAVPQFGLIAEEVNDIDPNLVVKNKDGAIFTVRYEAINAMLLNEFLKDHRKLQNTAASLDQKQSELDALKAEMASLRKLVEQLSAQAKGGLQ